MRISRRLKKVFERAGPETVRALLFNAVANRDDLPSELVRISERSEERRAAIHWLRKKERAAKDPNLRTRCDRHRHDDCRLCGRSDRMARHQRDDQRAREMSRTAGLP
jgi:hypothetical protein